MNAPGSPLDVDAAVIGAGITGLVAAWRLARRGLRVVVIDAGRRPGGVIGSVARDGGLFERGPNSALETSPVIAEISDALGLRDAWRYASETASRRYVVRDGAPLPLPMSPPAFLRTPLFSWSAKLRLLREPFVAAAAPDQEEAIAAFVRRRLGREFLDYAIDPFVAGIYAGDPERISVPAAFPKLHALEQRWGSLIKGQFLGARERKRRGEVAKNAARSFSFAGGMQQLTDALAAQAGTLLLDTRVRGLRRDGPGGFVIDADRDGTAVSCRAGGVIVATAAPAMAAMLEQAAPRAAAALRRIEYAPVATVASAYARSAVSHPLDGFGALVPRREARQVLGVLFSSSMFEGRAPQGQVLLTTFIGGLRQPELVAREPDAIAALAHQEHAALLGASARPLWQEVTRWPQAIPQYTLGHLDRVAEACTAESDLPGLMLGGSWRGGVSVGDCIQNGHGLAERLAAYLAARPVASGQTPALAQAA